MATPTRNGTIVAPSRNAVAILRSSREKERWISKPEINIKRTRPKLLIKAINLPSAGKAPNSHVNAGSEKYPNNLGPRKKTPKISPRTRGNLDATKKKTKERG